MTTVFYVSWHPSRGMQCSRCFETDSERAAFLRHIAGIAGSAPATWEKDIFESEEEARNEQ